MLNVFIKALFKEFRFRLLLEEKFYTGKVMIGYYNHNHDLTRFPVSGKMHSKAERN